MFNEILHHYGIAPDHCTVQPFGNGLINHTWRVLLNGKPGYILQKVNTAIFKHPEHIAQNIEHLGRYLRQQHPGYLFAGALPGTNGEHLYVDTQRQHYRLFPFIEGSHALDRVHTASQAFEAARQFARFTRLLNGFDTSLLHLTIPQFHDLSLRYRQFREAVQHGNPQRIAASADLIGYLEQHQHLVHTYENIRQDAGFTLRVVHHDTKISNVLFNEQQKGLCVIDLDTVMPGYFISDVGDMMRTYLSPVNEEEKDSEQITIRDDFFTAIARGYLGELNEQLSATEQAHFVYAGQFMIYMQALRFLTDHLNNDIYYGARYDGHNYYRAKNQAVLLQQYNAKSALFEQLIAQL